jgi:hypothetical protein
MLQLNSSLTILQQLQKSSLIQAHRSIASHLSLTQLNHSLAELPQQFQQPTIRPWQKIDWRSIDRSQIHGIKLEVFLAVLQGSMDTEAPIRGYTQTSRQYLENLYPQMAIYIGGTHNDQGRLTKPGLWEKEERQHTPALIKIYRQLSGHSPVIDPHTVRDYQPTDNRDHDLFKHGLHRTATEFAAGCLYLWLMAHTSGSLRQVLQEIATDEINHATRFWGFGIWAYPQASWRSIIITLVQTANRRLTYSDSKSGLLGTIQRMTNVMGWPHWTWQNRASFTWISLQALWQMLRWSRQLDRQHLNNLFGQPSVTTK